LAAMTQTTNHLLAAKRSQVMEVLAARLSPEEANRLAKAVSRQLIEAWKQPECVGETRDDVVEELLRLLRPPAPAAVALLAGAVAAPQQGAFNAVAGLVHANSLYPGGRQPFRDQWDAVKWLRQHHSDLDLDSPPQRKLTFDEPIIRLRR